jgi:hypothetical protein
VLIAPFNDVYETEANVSLAHGEQEVQHTLRRGAPRGR